MELEEFIRAVVPAGVILLAKRVEKVNQDGQHYYAFSHHCLDSSGLVTTKVAALERGSGDTYFALAAYKQGFHTDSRGKKVVRVRANVHSLQALWLDIDFKITQALLHTAEKPESANPVATAVEALRAFSKKTGMPSPSILVHSGNGIHAYWPLAESLGLDTWQKLADAFKEATRVHEVPVDHACTADACRVLRPPGTKNWKDPANPKDVRILYSNGVVHNVADLESLLAPYMVTKRSTVVARLPSMYDELTGGLVKQELAPSSFANIIKHCAVSRMVAENRGQSCTEPEWVGILQLLKHCSDGEEWVHAVSDGHPGYSPSSTDAKWEQRKANTAGPTLCKTFDSFHPEICARCPHNGFIKTPVQVGVDGVQDMDGMPTGWRIADKKSGVERLMMMDLGDGKTEKEWVKVLRYIPSNLRVTRSVIGGKYDLQFEVEYQNSKPWTVTLPGLMLGNSRKLTETLADCGLVLKTAETKAFLDLMATWLAKLQAARRVADVTEHLGWLTEGEAVSGFSCGQTTFYSDGRVRNDVRAAREFAAIARYYEPRGQLEPWKRVAEFICEQGNPAFLAVLSASFASPLLKFTGLSGGILSIVSTASGVGKSSALKVSQAVWGSPTHGINAVDDTPKSVARKLGFLNNLPAYWDELRGRKTVEDFLTLAFQLTQGKERSRLDSSAQIRETATWETMLVVASNESIFEAMSRGTAGSDAGVVRTFEMTVDPFKVTRNKAEIALLFEQLNTNYGHAGRVYAQYIATHPGEVEKMVQTTFTTVAQACSMEASERFWIAMMSVLLVGANLANRLELTKIDTKLMMRYLLANLKKLRGRSEDVNHLTEPSEIIAAFMQTYQDRALTVDKFPAARQNTSSYMPEIVGGAPRGDKIMYHISRDEHLMRVPINELARWLEFRELPVYSITKRIQAELSAKTVRVRLGIGTKWELPPQRCYEFSTSAYASKFDLALETITAGDSSRPGDMTDSPSEEPPEG